MVEMSSGTALRQLQQAQAGMKKARQTLRQARAVGATPEVAQRVLQVGWESLTQAHKLLGSIPLSAATEPVLTKQLAVQRYATALLVRLRRIVRNEPGALDGLDEDSTEDEE
ncbi:MAG: hypothetical protein ABI353_10540 [Isosphaeraceae bacterium]